MSKLSRKIAKQQQQQPERQRYFIGSCQNCDRILVSYNPKDTKTLCSECSLKEI